MKTLRLFVLTLSLSLSAFAGDMGAGITAPPPPPPDSQATTSGEITTGRSGDVSTSVMAVDPATEVALSLMQGLLSLF